MRHAVVLPGSKPGIYSSFLTFYDMSPRPLCFPGRNGLLDEILSSFSSSWRLGGLSLAPQTARRWPFRPSTKIIGCWPSLQQGVEQLMSDYGISTGSRHNFAMYNPEAPVLVVKGLHIDTRMVSNPPPLLPRRRELAHSSYCRPVLQVTISKTCPVFFNVLDPQASNKQIVVRALAFIEIESDNNEDKRQHVMVRQTVVPPVLIFSPRNPHCL